MINVRINTCWRVQNCSGKHGARDKSSDGLQGPGGDKSMGQTPLSRARGKTKDSLLPGTSRATARPGASVLLNIDTLQAMPAENAIRRLAPLTAGCLCVMQLVKRSSVIQSDFDLLLWRRDNLIFIRPREAWQLCDRLRDDFQGLLNFILGNNKRRSKPDDVLMGRFRLHRLS